MTTDTAFEMATSNIRFGPGTTREVGMDLADMDCRRVIVLTDPKLAKLPPVAKVIESLESEKVPFRLFNRVRVEPTDESFRDAIEFARAGEFDAFVAVGGGSVMDTAKAANLYSTYPPVDFLDYVNPPIVPHGMSVILNAPAVFRFTAQACPGRHMAAAEILGADVSRATAADAGKILADRLVDCMQRLGMPNGLAAVGYNRDDIPALVNGTLPQHRVTKLSPRPASEDELAKLFEDAMTAW